MDCEILKEEKSSSCPENSDVQSQGWLWPLILGIMLLNTWISKPLGGKSHEKNREKSLSRKNSGKEIQTNILNYFFLSSFPRQCHYPNLKESDSIHFLFVVASPMNTWWFWITKLPAVALMRSIEWRARRGPRRGIDRLCTSSCVSCFNSIYFELSSFWSSGRVRKMSILPASRAGCQSSGNDLLWQMAMASGYVGGLQPSDR